MMVLGISPLDKDATVSLVEDGKVLFAAAEERYSRKKQHAGFPAAALDHALEATGTRPEQIDRVVYSFLSADQEARLMRGNAGKAMLRQANGKWREELDRAKAIRVSRGDEVPGLNHPDQRIEKGTLRSTGYSLLGLMSPMSDYANRRNAEAWLDRATEDHRRWQDELHRELTERGLIDKLHRYEHHLSHAANAFYSSGFDRALVLTLDGYGSGLTGSVSLGEGDRIERLHNMKFPNSLGIFYENVTSALGFRPDRHAGKIVGLAAYGDPDRLSEVLLSRIKHVNGDFQIFQPFNYYFDRHLAASFPMIDVAAAYQHVLEVVACRMTRHWLERTGCVNVVLSGGVAANVKMNQRIYEVEGVEGIFVYPNMGDGGCGTGLALYVGRRPGGHGPIRDVYYGPGYSDAEIQQALEAAGLQYEKPNDLAGDIARRIDRGEVVARFGGRMEYGPRALGNRSILYHGRDPKVNQWLNKRLGRTEFMPFAPVTLWEHRHDYYNNVAGAEHTAQFMTITFDCTDLMRRHCPAAVHVDGTARPQLIRREVNPGYYDIIEEYRKLSGSASVINTSFNMHEEPIVCTPQDAIRAFLLGRLDVLNIGPFVVTGPGEPDRGDRGSGQARS